MKVRVGFTVEIDPEAWDLNYGTGTEAAVIREDVRTYIEQGARDQLAGVGVLKDQEATR